MKKIKAFTLAEVLITLAVIGIVAALTIPVVVQKYKRKVVEVQLMKSYNTISNAFKLSEVENGSIESWNIDNSSSYDTFFDKYFAPYIKGSGGSSKKIALKDLGYEDNIKLPDGSNVLSNTYIRSCLQLNDGSVIIYNARYYGVMSDDEISPISYIIFYDINGVKGPNRIAQDVFIYEMPKKNGYPLLMFGEYNIFALSLNASGNTGAMVKNSQDDIINSCKNKQSVEGVRSCGAWIKLNGWKIPDDYPYL